MNGFLLMFVIGILLFWRVNILLGCWVCGVRGLNCFWGWYCCIFFMNGFVPVAMTWVGADPCGKLGPGGIRGIPNGGGIIAGAGWLNLLSGNFPWLLPCK